MNGNHVVLFEDARWRLEMNPKDKKTPLILFDKCKWRRSSIFTYVNSEGIRFLGWGDNVHDIPRDLQNLIYILDIALEAYREGLKCEEAEDATT